MARAHTSTKKKIVLAALKARLKRRNREFAKLTRSEKRIRIAKDVLEQLKTGKLKAKHLVYLQTPTDIHKGSGEEDLGTVLETLPQCDVCARSAPCSRARSNGRIT